MKNPITAIVLAAALTACANEPSEPTLPQGESGAGESIDAFLEICVRSNEGNGPALFERVRSSGYEIHFEVVQRRTRYEAKATSFKGKREGICPIHVIMEDDRPNFRCQFVVSKYCSADAPDEFGTQLESLLTQKRGISFNPQASEEKNKPFNTGRHHVFDVRDSLVLDGQILLTYGGGVGSKIYLSSKIKSNHDFTDVMSAREAMQKMMEDLEKEDP